MSFCIFKQKKNKIGLRNSLYISIQYISTNYNSILSCFTCHHCFYLVLRVLLDRHCHGCHGTLSIDQKKSARQPFFLYVDFYYGSAIGGKRHNLAMHQPIKIYLTHQPVERWT